MGKVLDGKYMTVSEAAAELSLSRQRVHALIKSGQLDSETIHERLIVIPRSSLDSLKKQERPSGVHIDQRNPQVRGRSKKC